MRKQFLFILLLSFGFNSIAQNINHKICISPGSLIGARVNLNYEKITHSKFTYGARLEYSTGWRTLLFTPTGRFYFFDEEATGLYLESGLGVRSTFYEGIRDEDFGSFAPQFKLGVGAQWFGGKKDNIPFDITLGFNIDPIVGSVIEEYGDGGALLGAFGPWSLIYFRLQTGLGF